jgi:hypothetical protein
MSEQTWFKSVGTRLQDGSKGTRPVQVVGENRDRCFHPNAQRRTRPNLCPPNLAQASLSLVTGVVASID